MTTELEIGMVTVDCRQSGRTTNNFEIQIKWGVSVPSKRVELCGGNGVYLVQYRNRSRSVR